MNSISEKNNLIYYILILQVLCLCSVNCEKVANLRSISKSENVNDNNKLLKLLDGNEVVILEENLKIDLEIWKSIDIDKKRIKGNGYDSKMNLYVGKTKSVRLLNNLTNCEIYNITIEIFNIDSENENEIENGLIDMIENCKIRKLNLIMNRKVVLSGSNGLKGLISNRIINSEVNDIGVVFNEIDIHYNAEMSWCLISCELSNRNSTYYKGVFVKGKTIILEPIARLINIGLLIYSTTNINFDYVVVDIENVKFFSFSGFLLSFFIDKSTTNIEMNHIMVVIRKKLSYEDKKKSSNSMYLCGVINEISNFKTLKLNHYLFDIHVDEIIMDFIEAKEKSMKRSFYISGISTTNLGNIIANYIQIKYHFNESFNVMKDRFCYVSLNGIHYCKKVKLAYLFVNVNKGDIYVNNSYISVKKEEDVNVRSVDFFGYNDKFSNVKIINSFITDPDGLVKDKSNLIEGDLFYIYLQMKNLNYNMNESLIYDSSMPYYHHSTNYINYDVFVKVAENEKYEFTTQTKSKMNISFIYIYVIAVLLLIASVAVYYLKYNNEDYEVINVNEYG